MIYPKFIQKKDTIGITSPSDGITKPEKLYRLDSAIKKWNSLGFYIYETKNVRTSQKGRSSSAKERANQFQELVEDDTIQAIICSSGGDFLLEILPYLDFSKIEKHPKWIQGFSDPTGLLYTITTNLDIATIYGDNFISFGMNPWHSSLNNNLEILKGNLIPQTNFLKYEKNYTEYQRGDEPYQLTEPVYWESIPSKEPIQITGRIIGGCLDILNDLFGTRFDHTKDFISKYQTDGIIWYFDICELSIEQTIRTLWKLKDNGWFLHTKGILFGRIPQETSYYNISLKEAISSTLKDLNIPILINTDIGHVSPRVTIINGAIATIESFHGKGTITFQLK